MNNSVMGHFCAQRSEHLLAMAVMIMLVVVGFLVGMDSLRQWAIEDFSVRAPIFSQASTVAMVGFTLLMLAGCVYFLTAARFGGRLMHLGLAMMCMWAFVIGVFPRPGVSGWMATSNLHYLALLREHGFVSSREDEMLNAVRNDDRQALALMAYSLRSRDFEQARDVFAQARLNTEHFEDAYFITQADVDRTLQVVMKGGFDPQVASALTELHERTRVR